MRRFFVNNIENMRDIGGYAIGKDKVVKPGKIIRTNLPTTLEEENIEELISMGFNTVIDLRNNDEFAKKKNVFFENSNFKYNHIKINGDGILPKSKDTVLDSYIEMLDGKEEIKKIFNILDKEEGGIIYFCDAGKDRTGVITACILKLLGVDNKDIIVDYIATGIFLREKLISFANSITDRDIFDIINPRYETMDGLLKYIDKNYGSIECYLIDCGVTKECIENVKNKYTMKVK